MEIIKENQEKPTLTRAEKVSKMKEIIKTLLKERDYKWNELLEAGAKAYADRYPDDSGDMNDVKGRCGSTFDLLEQAGEATFKDNICSLVKKEEKPKKTTKAKKKVEEKAAEAPVEEKPKKTTRAKKKTEEQPASPVAEEKPKKATKAKKKTEEQSVAPVEEKPKKTARTKKKTEVKAEETPAPVPPVVEEKPVAEEKPVEKKEEQKTVDEKTPVFDMTLLLGGAPVKKEEKTEAKTEPKAEVKTEIKVEEKAAEGTPMPVQKTEAKPVEKKPTAMPEFSFLGNAGLKKDKEKEKQTEKKPVEQKPVEKKPEQKPAPVAAKPSVRENVRRSQNGKGNVGKTVTPDEALKGEFIKRLRGLGGNYFEYYSVYLLERYSMRNGRRLESLKVSGGDRDGGIDGEITLTDKFGFRETIYIQAKNWDDTRGGNPEKWMVGETYLQQFIGAVACRQAKEGIQHCRGIFVTASHFTEDAKAILENMSDKFVGYDADDLFDAAKECSFGLKKENGEWKLDEKLLSGEKAFFDLY